MQARASAHMRYGIRYVWLLVLSALSPCALYGQHTVDVAPSGSVSLQDEAAAHPFDGSTESWPTPAEMQKDVWSAPDVPSSLRPASRVFDVLPAGQHFRPSGQPRTPNGVYNVQKVVVTDHADAVAWVPLPIPCDLVGGPSWNGLAADEGAVVTTEQCWYDSEASMHDAARSFVARFADVLTKEFGVAKELPCKLARGLYATKIGRASVPDDVWHHDMCRAEPNIFITALAYPHDQGWRATWRGHTEFARVDCSVDPPPTKSRVPPALRVAPMPNRTVVFSGRIYHTTSSAEATRRSRRSDPKASRNRYSLVLRLHCCRGKYKFSNGKLKCKK